MDGDHTNGALGLDPLDRLNQTTGNAQATDRDGIVEAQGWRSKTMLFQPYCMYRTLCIEQWGAPRADANDVSKSKMNEAIGAGPLGQSSRRQQSGQVIGNALLQAIPAMAKGR